MKKKYDLATIQSNIESMLLRALQEHEEWIKAYGEASDNYSETMVRYRKAKSDVVARLKGKGEKVTIIESLAQGETIDLKGEVIKAEGYMKKCQMYVNALQERIQTIKFIGKRIDGHISS